MLNRFINQKILSSESGLIGIISVVLLILGILIGVYLVQTRTNLLPKAFESVSGPIGSPPPSVQKTATIRLLPKPIAVIGQEVPITVAFTSHVDSINLISAQINYPQDKLDIVSITLDTTNFNNTFENYYGNGQISIIMGNTSAVKTADINSGISIAKIVFKTKTSGVSEITLNQNTSKVLRVGDGANILNVENQMNASISVFEGPTVTPSPVPLPTPIGAPGPAVSFRVVPFCKGPGLLVNRIEHKWIQGSWANTIYRNPPYANYGESIDVGWARDGFSDPYEDNKEIQFNTTYTYRLGTGEGILGPVTVTTPASCDGNLPPAGKITDLTNCDVIRGYACDKTDLSKPVQVNFYADGLADNGGISLGSTIADKSAPSNFNVNTDFGFSGSCGTGDFFAPAKPVFFEFPVPYSVKDGKTHKLYAHAVNNPAGYNKPLNGPISSDTVGNGNNFTCAKPSAPPPIPPQPTPSPIAEIACQPSTQLSYPNRVAAFSVSGNPNSQTKWSAPEGTPSSGLGNNFQTIFKTVGQFKVSVTNGGPVSTCTVNVSGGTPPPVSQACGQLCSSDASCQGAADGCTSCLPNPSTGASSCQPPLQQACTLVNAQWVVASNPAESNTTAELRVEATGDCANKQINFTIQEDDALLGNDPVKINPSAVFLVANPSQGNFVAKGTWITEFQEDGFFGANNPPEYEFTAQIVGQLNATASSQTLLQVLRSAGTPSPLHGDINNDKVVDLADLSWLLSNWGKIDNEFVDYNKDGVINNFDLAAEKAILIQIGVLRSPKSGT